MPAANDVDMKCALSYFVIVDGEYIILLSH